MDVKDPNSFEKIEEKTQVNVESLTLEESNRDFKKTYKEYKDEREQDEGGEGDEAVSEDCLSETDKKDTNEDGGKEQEGPSSFTKEEDGVVLGDVEVDVDEDEHSLGEFPNENQKGINSQEKIQKIREQANELQNLVNECKLINQKNVYEDEDEDDSQTMKEELETEDNLKSDKLESSESKEDDISQDMVVKSPIRTELNDKTIPDERESNNKMSVEILSEKTEIIEQDGEDENITEMPGDGKNLLDMMGNGEEEDQVPEANKEEQHSDEEDEELKGGGEEDEVEEEEDDEDEDGEGEEEEMPHQDIQKTLKRIERAKSFFKISRFGKESQILKEGDYGSDEEEQEKIEDEEVKVTTEDEVKPEQEQDNVITEEDVNPENVITEENLEPEDEDEKIPQKRSMTEVLNDLKEIQTSIKNIAMQEDKIIPIVIDGTTNPTGDKNQASKCHSFSKDYSPKSQYLKDKKKNSCKEEFETKKTSIPIKKTLVTSQIVTHKGFGVPSGSKAIDTKTVIIKVGKSAHRKFVSAKPDYNWKVGLPVKTTIIESFHPSMKPKHVYKHAKVDYNWKEANLFTVASNRKGFTHNFKTTNVRTRHPVKLERNWKNTYSAHIKGNPTQPQYSFNGSKPIVEVVNPISRRPMKPEGERTKRSDSTSYYIRNSAQKRPMSARRVIISANSEISYSNHPLLQIQKSKPGSKFNLAYTKVLNSSYSNRVMKNIFEPRFVGNYSQNAFYRVKRDNNVLNGIKTRSLVEANKYSGLSLEEKKRKFDEKSLQKAEILEKIRKLQEELKEVDSEMSLLGSAHEWKFKSKSFRGNDSILERGLAPV